MLKFRDKELDAEQFALEYVRHHVLCKSKHKRDKYKCVVAYQELAKRFDLRPWQARAFEKQFRNYVYEKMQSCVEAGLRDAAELPDELHWLRLIEDKFKLLPNLLQERGISPVETPTPERVLRALCTQAALRGAAHNPDMFATVKRALRLSADLRELQDVWSSSCRLALQFVSLCGRAGDALAPPPQLARVADLALLYTDVTDFQLVDDESEQRFAEAEALSVLWQLVQRHGLEDAMRADRGWSRAAAEYVSGGRRASALVLRRRWHELKLRARRQLLAYWRAPSDHPPTALHIAIIKRYPHIVTSPMPSWSAQVASGEIVYIPLNEQDFAEPTVEEPPPPLVTSQAPSTVTSPSALSAVTSRAPSTVTSHKRQLSPQDEETKLVKPDPEAGHQPQAVNIKTDVLDNEPYDARSNTQNDTDNKYETEIKIKKEPRETMSSRILFENDDDINDDANNDDGDGEGDMYDDISESDSDADIRSCDFDNKLLTTPRIQLTRLQHEPARRETEDTHAATSASRILFEDDVGEVDTGENNEDNGQEVWLDVRRTKTMKRCRLSKAQKSIFNPKEHDGSFYMKPRVLAQEDDNSKQSSATFKGLPTISQLNQVLVTLTNVSCADNVLKQTRQYCCLARKHLDISDARRRMGIAPTPHIHPDNRPCTCCCARTSAPRLPDLQRSLAALQQRLERLLQDASLRKRKNLPTTSYLQDLYEASLTNNPTMTPKPLSVANTATRFEPAQSSSVTHTPNKAKEDASELARREAVTPLHSKPAPVKVATIEHMPHDRGDGALTPPLPKARSDIPVQVELINDDTLVFPALVKTSVQLRVEIRDNSSPAYVLRPYNAIPLQVKLRCNKTIKSDPRAVGDIVAHVARLINKILVQVAIRRNKEQINQVLYIELECNIKSIHSAFLDKDIYVEMVCDKISFSGTLDQSGSASREHSYYKIFVHGPLLKNKNLVYKTKRNEIKKQNVKQYNFKSTTIILDSFCNKMNRFEQFLTYPVYKEGCKSTPKNKKRNQSKKKQTLHPASAVSAPQNEIIVLKETDSECENPEVISLDSISERSTVILGHEHEIINIADSDPPTDNTSSTAAFTAAAHDDDKQNPSEPNIASKSVKLSDRDKLKLFSSKHKCKYMRRTMDLLMQSKNLPPVTLHENPIPTLFVGEYPKKPSQTVKPPKNVVHEPVPNDLSRRDYSQTPKIKPRAYSNSRQNSSKEYSEIIHKSIEVNDTDRIVDHEPGNKSLSVSIRNNIVTHNELMLVQKLKEKFKEQPNKLKNKKKKQEKTVKTKGVSQVQQHRAHPSTSNNSAAQNLERESSNKTKTSLPERCVSPKKKSNAVSNKKSSKSSKYPDMPIIMDTVSQPITPKNSETTEFETSNCSASVEQQSVSPDVTPDGHSDQAPKPDPVPSVPPNDEDSETLKAAKLIQLRIKEKSSSASNENSKSCKDPDMPIIMDTVTQPLTPKNLETTETKTSKCSAPVEQQSVSPDVTHDPYSAQAPEPDPVPSVPPNDEDSETIKAARLVQRQISDGIRKGLMFMVPSSLRGKNNIINVPETVNHAKLLATEYFTQLESYLENGFEVLDPVRLIPLTSIPDELKLGSPRKMEPIQSGKQLQEVPVISETDLLDPAAKAKRASDASKNRNPPPVLSNSLIQRRHSHHNLEPDTTKELSSLKHKIRAEWLKKFVPTHQLRRRRQSVPNSSYPARSKLLSPINSAASMSDKRRNSSSNQTCKITEKKQCKVQIRLSGANDPKPTPRLVRRDTIMTAKPVLTETNGQGGFPTLEKQLVIVSPKIVSQKPKTNAKYLEKINSPTVMPQPLRITKRPACLLHIYPWAGLSNYRINICKKLDPTVTNVNTIDNDDITPPIIADTAPNSNSDIDSTDTENPNSLKRLKTVCQNENHQEKKVKMNIPIPPPLPSTEIENIPDPPSPLPSTSHLAAMTPEERLSSIMSDQKEVLSPSKCILLSDTLVQRESSPLCIAIPQPDDLQLGVSENEQLCLTLADSDRHLLMLESIPKPTTLNAFVQVCQCQNTEQIGSTSFNISPSCNQKISGKPTNQLKNMTDFVLTTKNKSNNAALTAANFKTEQSQRTTSKANSQVCIVEHQIMVPVNTTFSEKSTSNATVDRLMQGDISLENEIPLLTEGKLTKRDQPLMFSDGVLEENDEKITKERTTIIDGMKTELKESMLAIIVPLDTTGIGDLCKPSELTPTTPWDLQNCGIDVENIPLPSDKNDDYTENRTEVATGSGDPEGTDGSKYVPQNKNELPLNQLEDMINTEDPTASQQELPTVFIYNPNAPIVAASSLSSDTMILRFDRCQIPLSMCREYLVLTDAKIPCNGPMYFTLAPHIDVVQVAMDLTNPFGNNNNQEQNSYDITVNENNIHISIRNNVGIKDNNESENGNSNGISDNKDMMNGNNILSTSTNNNNENKSNANEAVVDEVTHKMDNSGVEPNTNSSTQMLPNQILSVVNTIDSFRGLLLSEARLWVLSTSTGRCEVLERTVIGQHLALYGDLGSDFLADLTLQLNADAEQPTSSNLEQN